ncbi:Acyl-CoA thioester hydrolase [Sphingomonas antarctica]|uniref:acyl-CoA thioesterase n=1 Tax=Sphingomonas antarctica TaxID=2040274 RepID=UPI0039E7C252
MPKPAPYRTQLETYPFTADIPTRWADLDLLGHINNVSMAGLFEEGRGRFNRSLELPRDRKTTRWLIAAVEINYLAEAHHPHDVTIASGIGRVGTRSWQIFSGAFQHGDCVATCDTTLVFTDETGAAEFPDSFRAKFAATMVRIPA